MLCAAARYPCGAFGGDSNSKQLVDAWQQNSLGLGGMVKGNIDKSVAGSVFSSEAGTKKLVEQVVRMYPALKDAKKELTFGYKIEYEGLPDTQEISVLDPEAANSGPLDKLRNMFSGN